MKVRLVNADELKKEMRVAGWMASVSTDSERDQMKIAEHCIKSGHGTPTRAMRFVFEIGEVSRAFSHEFVRHEIGVAKVQRSQRYVKEDKFKYTTPESLKGKEVEITLDGGTDYQGAPIRPIYRMTFDDVQSIIEQFYNGAVEQGVKAEDARYVLSNATHTKLHVSFNFEGLQKFLYRRCCTRAQWEIREVALAIQKLILQELPFLEPLIGAPCHVHGYCPEVKGCGIAPSKKELMELAELGRGSSRSCASSESSEDSSDNCSSSCDSCSSCDSGSSCD